MFSEEHPAGLFGLVSKGANNPREKKSEPLELTYSVSEGNFEASSYRTNGFLAPVTPKWT